MGKFYDSGYVRSKKPKIYRKLDWCIRAITVIICLPFLLIGYGLGTAYTLAKEGWRIGRDI